MPTAPLTTERRNAALEQMSQQELDVLVIGGGVTGVGAALDAATRGLRVGLVEKADFAQGTSSRSTKLMHGGLRYLEQLDFKLVREALQERGLAISKLCPHLVKGIPILYPLTRKGWERPYTGAGVLLYDILAGTSPAVPRHRHYSKKKAMQINPGLDPDVLTGGIRYYDGQVDDARHTMFIGRTAAKHGAHIATYAEVTDLTVEAGHVVGATVRDNRNGTTFDVRAKQTINAAGPWTDVIQRMGGNAAVKVQPSKGIHFLIDKEKIPNTTGLILRTEKSVLFTIPWGKYWIIGTTDTAWEYDVEEPAAHAGDIDYLLERLNAVLVNPITHEDIRGVFSGLRPLVVPAEGSASTAKLSREHAVMETMPGLLTIAGGKYTTYRVMAKDVVDAAAERLPQRVPDCITEDVLIMGAEAYWARMNERERIASDSGLHVGWITHLLDRYGDMIDELLAMIEEQPDLGKPLESAPGYLRVEALYGATHEGAQTLEDIIARRTRAFIEQSDRGMGAAKEVADLVAEPLGWDEDRVAREIDQYRKIVDATLAAEQASTDQAAYEARKKALA